MTDSQLPPESMPESVVEWLSEQDAATLREVQDHIDQLIEQRTDPITVEDIEPVDIGNSMFGPRTRIQKIEKDNQS